MHVALLIPRRLGRRVTLVDVLATGYMPQPTSEWRSRNAQMSITLHIQQRNTTSSSTFLQAMDVQGDL